MEPDIRDELVAAQRDWLTITAELRQRRQDIVMKALARGNTKYAIAQVMDVRGPTVDSIVKTATQAPKQPQAEQ